MPFVYIRRSQKVNDAMTEVLSHVLPKLVVEALSVPNSGGELAESDIEVEVRDVGPFDVATKDVEIIIWAGDYPERKANLDERREQIIKGVKLLSDPGTPSGIVSCFVWVILAPNSFGEFSALFD
ncbi:hypothetical protein L6252_04110 [Candidatus Parcubacteria bacterium]|nr:hypothetical protein [Candidatus Parcubacteria bacterium]